MAKTNAQRQAAYRERIRERQAKIYSNQKFKDLFVELKKDRSRINLFISGGAKNLLKQMARDHDVTITVMLEAVILHAWNKLPRRLEIKGLLEHFRDL
jgi:hypothetical protein